MSAADEIRAYTAGIERARAAYYRDLTPAQVAKKQARGDRDTRRMRAQRARRKDDR